MKMNIFNPIFEVIFSMVVTVVNPAFASSWDYSIYNSKSENSSTINMGKVNDDDSEDSTCCETGSDDDSDQKMCCINPVNESSNKSADIAHQKSKNFSIVSNIGSLETGRIRVVQAQKGSKSYVKLITIIH